MRVTKLEHAALRVDLDGQSLLIDPGSFTSPIDDLGSVVAVVLTHEHPDHWTTEHLDRIRAAAPDIPIYAPEGVVHAAPGYDILAVNPGDTAAVAPFELRFFGGKHAVIHETIPIIDNVGVLVNETLYYPGDSYAVPKGVDVPLLAAPIGAPWLKVGDAMDFVLAVGPHQAFGTHDMTLSVAGLAMHRARLTWATEEGEGTFLELDPGDSVDV